MLVTFVAFANQLCLDVSRMFRAHEQCDEYHNAVRLAMALHPTAPIPHIVCGPIPTPARIDGGSNVECSDTRRRHGSVEHAEAVVLILLYIHLNWLVFEMCTDRIDDGALPIAFVKWLSRCVASARWNMHFTDEVAEFILLDSVVPLGFVIARVAGAADVGQLATLPATRGDNARYVPLAAEGRRRTRLSLEGTYEVLEARKLARIHWW